MDHMGKDNIGGSSTAGLGFSTGGALGHMDISYAVHSAGLWWTGIGLFCVVDRCWSEGLSERLALSSSARHFHPRKKNTTAKMNSTKSALANRTGRQNFAYHLNSSTQHSNEQRVLSYCTSLLDNDSKE